MALDIQSEAFRKATLRSERYRIIGVIVVVATLSFLPIARALINRRPDELFRTSMYLGFWACCLGYEAIMLTIATRAERAGRSVSSWVWVLNTIIEGTLPSLALVGLTMDKEYLGPYRAQVSPAILIYTFFIILSTLRLSPGLSALSGCVSAMGYVAVYVFTRIVAPTNPNRTMMPPETFIFLPLLLLCAGLIAAAVAGQIRRHVVAALAEADTRRKLDRIEYDLKVARSIQMGLLPKKPPAVSGYDIAGRSEPADQTGGDYFDWIELPGGRIMFTIADATGHGIGPALLIAACRAYFRAIASHNDPLEKITQQVDALLAEDASDGRFVTAAVALLEPQEHRLSLYSAGQAPMYLCTASTDQITAFEADQPPLGTYFGLDGSRARRLELLPGDAIVLVTDGFFESRDPSRELLGIDRLGETIRQHHARPASALIEQLYARVKAFTQGAEQEDDMTVVVIKRN